MVKVAGFVAYLVNTLEPKQLESQDLTGLIQSQYSWAKRRGQPFVRSIWNRLNGSNIQSCPKPAGIGAKLIPSHVGTSKMG